MILSIRAKLAILIGMIFVMLTVASTITLFHIFREYSSTKLNRKMIELEQSVFLFTQQIDSQTMTGKHIHTDEDFLKQLQNLDELAAETVLFAKRRYRFNLFGNEELIDLSENINLAWVQCKGLLSKVLDSTHHLTQWEKLQNLSMARSKVVELVEKYRGVFEKESESKKRSLMLLVFTAITISALLFFYTIAAAGRWTFMVGNHSERLKSGAKSVQNQAQLLHHRSQDFSTECSTQIDNITRTYGSVDEIVDTMRNTNTNVESITKNINDVVASTKQGAHTMVQVVDSMRRIDESNHSVQGITTLLENIIEKMNILDKIVSKTQILAYNAAIEAQSVGEIGSGFAVVADEISSLAVLSGRSAKEISELIENGYDEVKKFLRRNQDSVNSGIEVTSKAHKDFQVILKRSEAIKKNVESLENLSEQQNDSIQSSINNLKSVTEFMYELSHLSRELVSFAQKNGQFSQELNQIRQSLDLMFVGNSLVQQIRVSNPGIQIEESA